MRNSGGDDLLGIFENYTNYRQDPIYTVWRDATHLSTPPRGTTGTQRRNRRHKCLPGNSAGALFGMVKWPLRRLSDLQIGDKKVTLNHLVQEISRNASSATTAAKCTANHSLPVFAMGLHRWSFLGQQETSLFGRRSCKRLTHLPSEINTSTTTTLQLVFVLVRRFSQPLDPVFVGLTILPSPRG